jgi:hypothetical protein
MLTDDELLPLKRQARLLAERQADYDAQKAVVSAAHVTLVEAQATLTAEQAVAREKSVPLDRSVNARDLLRRHVAGTIDDVSACRTALEWAPEVAPELVGPLTDALAARVAAQEKAPPPMDPAAAALDAAVDKLLAG